MEKRLLVEADGGPLAVAIAGANVPDAKLLEQTIGRSCYYLGLLKLACALLWFRRYHRLTTS